LLFTINAVIIKRSGVGNGCDSGERERKEERDRLRGEGWEGRR